MQERTIEMHPNNIENIEDLIEPWDFSYGESKEKFSYGARFGKKFGLSRVGVNYEILPPNHRTSWPHAHKIEEEFVYVLEGHPHLWQDGKIYPLRPGDGVGFPGGTGISHTIINNTNVDVKLLVVGENLDGCKIVYPMHPKHNQKMKNKGFLWEDRPINALGNHDGFPDQSAFKQEAIQQS